LSERTNIQASDVANTSGLAGEGGIALQRAALKTDAPAQFETKITYGGVQDFTFQYGSGGSKSDKVASWMNAELDPQDVATGTDTSSASGVVGHDLYVALGNNTGSSWVRGHLLNHDLGGVAFYNNLFPITSSANREHYHEVEKQVKYWVANGNTVKYNVAANQLGKDGKGEFVCHAWQTTDDSFNTVKQNEPRIHKKILSSPAKVLSTRHYADQNKNRQVNAYSSVLHEQQNGLLRDSIKSLQKSRDWQHARGKANLAKQLFDTAITARLDAKGNFTFNSVNDQSSGVMHTGAMTEGDDDEQTAEGLLDNLEFGESLGDDFATFQDLSLLNVPFQTGGNFFEHAFQINPDWPGFKSIDDQGGPMELDDPMELDVHNNNNIEDNDNRGRRHYPQNNGGPSGYGWW